MMNTDILNSLIKLIAYCQEHEKCDEKCFFFKQEPTRKICTIGIPKNWQIPSQLLEGIDKSEEVDTIS